MGLFDWLTGRTAPGAAGAGLYARVIAEARMPAFYRDGGLADTMDGRFAALASVLALVLNRLERAGETGAAASVALTEAFIADMDTQMREAGFGDPSLGKQVRSLVGALAARVERLRNAEPRTDAWDAAARWALYKDEAPGSAASGVALLAELDARLDAASDAAIIEGRWS